MNIIIDSRENKLIELFQNNNISFIKKQLEIGDIILQQDDKIFLLIERKTIPDLIASIKDGRYKEQKTRILSKINVENVLYLIEGRVDNIKFDEKIIFGSITNMIFRDNIKLINTGNLQQSFDLILNLKKKFIEGTFQSKENLNYNDTIKLNKKDNITNNIFNIQVLANIPGVSFKMAEIILKDVKSIKDLILKYDNYNLELQKDGIDIKNIEKLKEELLKDIQYSEKRKIGKIISKRIYHFLYKDN
jgi:ERCC4-type nuclease